MSRDNLIVPNMEDENAVAADATTASPGSGTATTGSSTPMVAPQPSVSSESEA